MGYIISALLVILLIFEATFPFWFHREVRIRNDMENGANLIIDCGLNKEFLPKSEEYSWHFYEFMSPNAKFECTVSYNEPGSMRWKRGQFVAYDSKQKICRHPFQNVCRWSIRVRGVCEFNAKFNRWEFTDHS